VTLEKTVHKNPQLDKKIKVFFGRIEVEKEMNSWFWTQEGKGKKNIQKLQESNVPLRFQYIDAHPPSKKEDGKKAKQDAKLEGERNGGVFGKQKGEKKGSKSTCGSLSFEKRGLKKKIKHAISSSPSRRKKGEENRWFFFTSTRV